MGIVWSLTIYEHKIIGSNHCIVALKDHKPIFSCLTKKGNFSPSYYDAQMHLTKIQKL